MIIINKHRMNLIKKFLITLNMVLIFISSTTTLAVATESCNTIYCLLDHGEFRLNNNKWGQSSATQSIFVNGDLIGWQWNNPGGGWNYPEVTVGTDFGHWKPSTSPSFPIAYQNVKSWTAEVTYKYTTKPTGSWWNFAYDIYWMSNADGSGTRKYNIMIWFDTNAGVNSNCKFGPDVSDGINTYTYCHDPGSKGWPWDAFILKNKNSNPVAGQTYTHKVNIKALIDKISNPEFTGSGSWTIPDIQLGNENENGVGGMEISKYNIELNGRLIQLSTTGSQSSPTPAPTTTPVPTTTPAPTTTPSTTSTSLASAVDNTALTFSTGGNANWLAENSISYYDGDAAQSGKIGNSRSSWIETTVTGPGTLTFYWKVSSEKYGDYLKFFVDGAYKNQITGYVGWTMKTYSIPSGTHKLRWLYVKDYGLAMGSDAGWIDKVRYTKS